MPDVLRGSDDRMLTFEVGGSLYALPIVGILEVADVGPLACIPSLPLSVAGVLNHHGDALPVLTPQTLLDVSDEGIDEPAHVLVITDREGRSTRLGLPVDRVLGLVAGDGQIARGDGPVADRRPIEGRLASILDPQRLVARAREVIDRSLATGE